MGDYFYVRKNGALVSGRGHVESETTGEELSPAGSGDMTILINRRLRPPRAELSAENLLRRVEAEPAGDPVICCRRMRQDEVAGRVRIPSRRMGNTPAFGRILGAERTVPFAFCPHCGGLMDILAIKRGLREVRGRITAS